MLMDQAHGTVSFRNEREVIQSTARRAIASFLDNQTCYAVLRPSAKIVVFNTRISFQLAFYALIEHDMPAAPLWDDGLYQFVGVLTVTDFIDVFRLCHNSKTPLSTLLTRSIAEILNDTNMPKPGDFVSVDSSASLKQACLLLHRNGLDFLPIVVPDDMRVLATITYTSILEHLVNHFPDQRRLFDDQLISLPIGTYHDDLVTTQPNETLATVLQLLHDHNLSTLPVVQYLPNGKRSLLGVYCRNDVTFLTMGEDAQQALNNLDKTVGEMLEKQNQQQAELTTADAIYTCRGEQTLQSIFESFSVKKFNRLYVVDDEDCVLGVVSARDLIAYFLEE